MRIENTGLEEYSTAQSIAATYKQCTTNIRRLLSELDIETRTLRNAFHDTSGYHFSFSIDYHGQRHRLDGDLSDIFDKMKCEAWSSIIAKLNIRRLMSSSRAKQLDESLRGERGSEPLPDIEPEMIQQVVAGYVSSATEFLEEAVREEYEFWRPGINGSTKYKTNAGSSHALQRKIIKPYMVRPAYRVGMYSVNYSDRGGHITALDSILHMLDGKGPVESYRGPLHSAIETTVGGSGETDYFRFKCFKNGNLHLEFRRLDLLCLFNKIAGGNNLADEKSHAHSKTT